jgi:uncharacterized membrane protein YfcA
MMLPSASVIGIVALAGMVRGVTGFGGAMFMAPPLSLIVGPVQAVIYALFLEAIAALNMIPSVWRRLNLRTLAMVGLPALLCTPIGGFLLTSLKADVVRYCIAVTVILFSAALLIGFRYEGRPHPATSAVLGSISGVLFGATSMGGPPVILYLLSGPDPHDVTRANLVAYISAVSALALVFPWYQGVLTQDIAFNAALLIVPYLAGTWFGSRCFSFMSEKVFRSVTLALMMTTGLIALLS